MDTFHRVVGLDCLVDWSSPLDSLDGQGLSGSKIQDTVGRQCG
jgi:hypothetical protein